MTAYYREIGMLQEPFDLELDSSGRAQIAFNIMAYKRPSETFLEELIQILVDDSVGTSNVDIFAGSIKALPTGAGPFIGIIETGGPAPERTHNNVTTTAYARPTAQLITHASTYAAARTMAHAAYNALVKVQNETVTTI